MSKLIKIRSVGAESFHADGQTDGRTHMIKLLVAFPNFVKASKKSPHLVGLLAPRITCFRKTQEDLPGESMEQIPANDLYINEMLYQQKGY